MNTNKYTVVTTTLDANLASRPGSKLEIARAMFSFAADTNQLSNLRQYFAYYTEELKLLRSGVLEQSWQSTDMACTTYEHVFHVVDTLRQNPSAKRPRIRDLLLNGKLKPCSSESSLNRAINLGLRLWLMVNIQEPKFETLKHGATCIEWNDTQTLKDFFTELFPQSRWQMTARASRMGPHFTAAFMHRVCGLNIEWTTNLYDHLHLDKRRKALKIFPYKCHLQMMMNDDHKSGDKTNTVLPHNLLHETKNSLDLLFPFWDSKTVSLLEREGQTFHEMGPFEVTKSLSLMDFDHWRDRLLELHEEVFLSPPASWTQLWRDDRNPQQFWTFWIAMVILGLTLVSNITSIIQTWASIKALNSR